MNKSSVLFLTCLTLMMVACASLGNPDGGPYDETPPKVVSSSPDNRAVNVQKKKASILFDEYIKLEKASEKVVVSPPQIEPANIRANGKSVQITFYDDLQPNTTYTIDFNDAIQDNNEGNPMGLYTYSFSTGETIDTMEVAGCVLDAQNLEPVKDMLVGLYPADTSFNDTILMTKPFLRVARTNSGGRFVVKGVKNGTYYIYALKDADGDFIFNQKNEMIAFDTITVTTSCKPDVRMDTIWRDTIQYDSIRVVPYTHFLPDDVILMAFLEEGQEQHLLKTEFPNPDYFRIFFTAPADSLPIIRGLNFDASCLVAEPSLHNDTITYWVTDTTYRFHQDTLSFELVFMETDTLGQLVPHTDTLEISPKLTHAKRWKEQKDKIDDWQKQQEKMAKRSNTVVNAEENPYLQTYLEVGMRPSSKVDPNQNLSFVAKEPFLEVDTTMVHFYQKVDTNWVATPFLFLPQENNKSTYVLYAEWEPADRYKIEVDSAAFRGILGHVNKPMKSEFSVASLEEFGSLFIHVISSDTSAVVVQLMNRSDKVVRELVADDKGNADFYYLKPGEYYLRCYVDRNGNGKWDTGSYREKLFPEDVYYFPKPLLVKAQWEIEQDWNIQGIVRTQQKPKEITKQKLEKKKDVRSRNREREEQKKGNKSGNGNSNSSGNRGSSSGRISGRNIL